MTAITKSVFQVTVDYCIVLWFCEQGVGRRRRRSSTSSPWNENYHEDLQILSLRRWRCYQ